ncbi:LacI family DNA-binding transcriptional regulator [Paenibacillus thailandensis]|uniref:LacI family DNA-binding transcriptional regulator n=1 Tax=Paenibacillus thailandensis TaxID=393250 RepID=A0ABW5R0T8_9BACL
MARKISIKTIASQLGISTYAVSRALSGKPGVSPATRSRVVELARSLGYQQHDSAPQAQEHSERSPSFVLICMNGANAGDPFYWQRLLNGMLDGCAKHGLQHVIITPDPQRLSAAKSPQEAIAPHIDWSRCGGIVIMGVFPQETMQLLTRTGKPYILVDHADPLLVCDKVNNDNAEAGMSIARHMLSLKCRRIAFLQDIARPASFLDRYAGARFTVDSAGLAGAELTEWPIDYASGDWPADAYAKLAAMTAAERPDAWIGANDDIAVRWMRKLQEQGFDIPADCRIAGIDNVEAAAIVTPPLTTVNLCKEELGLRAIEALHRRMERPGAPFEKIMLSTNLVVRSST